MTFVAAYCRVSTEKEDQQGSFESQVRFFGEYINAHPDWALFHIYADEGISGTAIHNRTAFLKMLEDAKRGMFQLILTKEVSRFSRNILDTITYTRMLKNLGVGVCFLNDGINTLDPDAELRLAIMGSIAQEESRRTSSRVKWGQTQQMRHGVVFGRSLLGYQVVDGKLFIEPQGATLVRLIFHKYGIEKKGTTVIARELETAGYQTSRGRAIWNPAYILRILKNEKYVGDLVQKKTYTPDYLTHQKKKNQGQEPLIIIKDHHEPIIPRPLWELVQSQISARHRKRQSCGVSTKYPFSGKIHCAMCGRVFFARRKKGSGGETVLRWCCNCGIGLQLRDELICDMVSQTIKKTMPDITSLIPPEKLSAFVGIILEKMIVYPGHLVEVFLNSISEPWIFQVESRKKST